MTRKKKTSAFEKLVTDILDGLEKQVPEGMLAVEVIGALEAAKLILANKMTKVKDLNSLIEGLLNDKD
jgi:hypothetical protein